MIGVGSRKVALKMSVLMEVFCGIESLSLSPRIAEIGLSDSPKKAAFLSCVSAGNKQPTTTDCSGARIFFSPKK